MASEEPAKTEQAEAAEQKVVFREKAHRLYLQNQQKLVFLKLARPQLFPYFWLLLGLLGLLFLVAWNTRVPVICHGLGLVVARDGGARLELLSLLPPDSLARLRPDQQLLVRGAGDRRPPLFALRIAKVEPAVLSPDAIRREYLLDGALGGQVLAPAAVALAPVGEEGAAAIGRYAGSSLPVEIEVGSQRVLGLVPGLRFLAGQG
jgi:hypothetical protein